MKIKIEQLSEEAIEERQISTWPVWEKEVSEFDWYYDQTEVCYILEGEVVVTTDKEKVTIKAGDYVTFPAGLSCRWKILKPIRKHYTFI